MERLSYGIYGQYKCNLGDIYHSYYNIHLFCRIAPSVVICKLIISVYTSISLMKMYGIWSVYTSEMQRGILSYSEDLLGFVYCVICNLEPMSYSNDTAYWVARPPPEWKVVYIFLPC